MPDLCLGYPVSGRVYRGYIGGLVTGRTFQVCHTHNSFKHAYAGTTEWFYSSKSPIGTHFSQMAITWTLYEELVVLLKNSPRDPS
jgi:hypothetical protein